MTHESSIVVLPVQVAFEGLRLQDGRMLTIAVDEPPLVYVVACRDGDEISIASKHSSPGEAETAARALVKRMQQAGEAIASTDDALGRIVKDAGRLN